MSSYRYAAYGSNLHPKRLRKRVPSAALIGTGFLPGFRLRFHKLSDVDGTGKCNIVAGGPGVYLAIFDIATSERMQLDQIEGPGYERQDIQVNNFGTCSTYIAISRSIDDSLQPADWYKEYVVRGARFHAFPEEYLSPLENLPAVADADNERSCREWKLVDELLISALGPDSR